MDMADLEERAKAVLDPGIFNWISHGGGNDLTVADNIAAWQRLRLSAHVLRDVSIVDTVTTMLGTTVQVPVMVAPFAWHANINPDAEAATARGAAGAGAVMVASSLSSLSLEEISAAAAGAPQWLQAHAVKDHGFINELIGRAAATGFKAIVITADNASKADRRPTLEGHRPVSGNYDRPGASARGFAAAGGLDPGFRSLGSSESAWPPVCRSCLLPPIRRSSGHRVAPRQLGRDSAT
jgi:4-hydroxymandelate oxidase